MDLVNSLFREAMVLLGVVSLPLFGALLIVGLVVGVLQAATQINDPAVGAIPRLAVAVLVCVLLGGWMTSRMAAFVHHCFTELPGAAP